MPGRPVVHEQAGGHLAACHLAEQVTARAVEETAATQSVIETAVDVD